MATYNLVLNSSNVKGTNKNLYSFNFQQGGFNVPPNSQICISQILLPYSWFNISKTYYSNSTISYNWYSTASSYVTYTYTFQDGFYSTLDLNFALQNYMISQNQYATDNTNGNYYFFINIYTNQTYYANQLILNPIPTTTTSSQYTYPTGFVTCSANYCPSIQFISNITSILGFSGTTIYGYQQTSSVNYLSSSIPNATPVNSIIILCDKVNNVINNPPNLIDTMPINSSFGSNINYTPAYEKWIYLLEGTYATLNIQFCDQNYNPLIMNDSNIMVSLLIKLGEKQHIKIPLIKEIIPKIKPIIYENEKNNITE
jgi:hypothetical protein